MTPRVLNATPSKAADLENGPIRIWKMPKVEGPADWSASLGRRSSLTQASTRSGPAGTSG